jgi:hypothetical protein
MPHPNFNWSEQEAAFEYSVQIASDSSFTTLVDQDLIAMNRYVHREPLTPGSYWWRVASVDSEGQPGPWSPSKQLTVQLPSNVYDIPDGASLASARATLNEATENTPAVVRFAQNGTYEWKPNALTQCLILHVVTDLILDGRGSTFVIQEPSAGFLTMNSCHRILVRNFIIDYDPLPHTVGTVLAINETAGTFDLQIMEGYLPPEDDTDPQSVIGHWGCLMNPDVPGRLKTGVSNHFFTESTYSEVGTNTYRLTLQTAYLWRISDFEVNDIFVKHERVNTAPLLGSFDSSDITLKGNTNFAAPGAHLAGSFCNSVNVLDSSSLLKPGRYTSASADSVHTRNFRVGPWVEGCIFEGQFDDAINIYGAPMFVTEQPKPDQVILVSDAHDNQVGDTLSFFDAQSGLPVSTATILGAEFDFSILGWRVDLSEPVGPLSPGLEKSNTTVYNLDRVSNHFVVRDNTFRNSRRYGTWIKAHHGLIENNLYEGLSSSPITLHNEPGWPEGLNVERILIRNNVLKASGFEYGYLSNHSGAIEAFLHKLPSDESPWIGHREVRIEGNTITDWEGVAIKVHNAADVIVKDNQIGNSPGNNSFYGATNYGIWLQTCEDVNLSDNQVTDTRPLTEHLHIEDCTNVMQ